MSGELHKPLYVQIQEYLTELIFSGKLPPETKVASERELSQELHVSRMTVRRAITEMVHDGMLVRRHGSGTYVAKPKVSYDARELIDHTQAMRSKDISHSAQLIEFSQVPVSKRLAGIFEVEIGHSLYRVVKLHLANRVPTVLERSYLLCSRCPDLEEYDLEKTAIYDLLVERYGVHITRVAQTVEAVVATETVAKQLRVEDDTPLLMLTRVIYHEDGKPVEYARDLLRGDYARIHSEFDL
jgi:GntR family transcriptional regulator